MLKFTSALSAIALMAACTASAGTPAQQSLRAEAPAPIVMSEGTTALAGALKPQTAPAPEVAAAPAQRAALVPAERAGVQVACDIRTQRTSNGLLIEAVARADEPLSGDYELVIRASGGGNASDLTQAGPFAAGHGRFVTLGQSEIAFGRGARLDATLTLHGENGESCRRDLRL